MRLRMRSFQAWLLATGVLMVTACAATAGDPRVSADPRRGATIKGSVATETPAVTVIESDAPSPSASLDIPDFGAPHHPIIQIDSSSSIGGGEAVHHTMMRAPPPDLDAPSLSLNTSDADVYYQPGEAITVDVHLDGHDFAVIVGGQFWLWYDRDMLDFDETGNGILPGDAPFTLELYEWVEETDGAIFYMVSITYGDSGTSGDRTMATIPFVAKSGFEACDVAHLVKFNTAATWPPTTLIDSADSTYVHGTNLTVTDLHEISIGCLIAQLEAGAVSVGGADVTVPLTNTYVSPVVVCSVQYNNNSTPVVARISNVTSNSFDVYLQNPSGGAVWTESVSYVVVEEGIWTVDGVKIEAQTYLSTVTDENNRWIGEAQSYGQSYANPVVLGQVMTENDPEWSVFWCRGRNRSSPPSASVLRTGKTVCEDTLVSRVDETVGFIVFEAGHGAIGGVEFEAAVGVDIVRGIDNDPPYAYTFGTAFATEPSIAVVTMAGMDGSDGGWAQGHGATLATATTLFLSVDEDQIRDTERKHTTEQVGYVVFETAVAYACAPECQAPADCDDGLYCNGAEDCVDGTCVAGTDPCPGQDCDEQNDVCVAG